jgi:hypothetical protein
MSTTLKSSLNIGLASVLAMALTAPAFAQEYQRPSPYDQPPAPQYRQTDPSLQDQQRYEQDRSDYQARRDAYDARKDAYDARRDTYENDRAGYERARIAYEHRRAEWQRARARYDARYGYGAYVRVYGPEPIWDTARWGPYYAAPAYYPAPAAGYYGRNSAYVTTNCRNDHSARTAGTVIGAIAGAALGSNLSAPGRHTENSVIGGVLGGAIGNAVGNAHDRYRCDTRGPYYSYNDTVAYREDPNWRSGRYDYGYYTRMRCRLAPAAVDAYGNDVRYVRVCPDADGRYRITG